MDATSPASRELHRTALVWDAHACVPLHPDCDLAAALGRHRAAGASFVSVNIGMDLNPLDQILPVIASFRAQVAARPDLLVQSGTVADVERAHREGRLAVAFDLEGAMPLCGRPEMVRLFRELGVRQIHLAYNRNNAAAGGCYDAADVPLTPLGRRLVAAIHAEGILMDLSHTGHRSSLDIMGLGLGPCMFSHANPRAVHHDLRNVTDEQIDACAATGGVVCVNGVGRFLTDPAGGTAALLDCVDYLADRIGPARVGLGVDYSHPAGGLDDDPPGLDRAYWWPPEHGYGGGITGIKIATPEQLPEITDGLLRRGYAETDVRAVLGLNMLELARRVWGGECCAPASPT